MLRKAQFYMNKSSEKKRFQILAISLCGAIFLMGIIAFTIATGAARYANVLETFTSIEVFVGDLERNPHGYASKRLAYIEALAETAPETMVTAVVGLADYYATDEVKQAIGKYNTLTVNRLYMWPEGETGVLSLFIESGDIDAGICAYAARAGETESDDTQFAQDLQRFINGEYGVYALTVTCSAEELSALTTDTDFCRYADVKYNDEVEQYAAEHNKTVYYTELPSKPDGAH